MKRNTRKGFTGIELVIVIAIIAILAASLIPAFGGLFKSANKTADVQLAKNLNTALLLHGINSDVDDFGDVLSAARAEGYLISNLNPTSEGYYLVWESESNQFLLVDSKNDYEVVFAASSDYSTVSANWHFITSDLEAAAQLEAHGYQVARAATTTSDLITLVAQGNGQTVYVDESIKVDVNNVIHLSNGSMTVDLGANSVTGGSDDESAAATPIQVTGGATLNLKGGVLSATAAFVDADGRTGYCVAEVVDGVLNIENTVISIDAATTYCVSYDEGTGTIKNVTFDIPNKRQAVGIFGGSVVLMKDCIVDAFAEVVFCSTSQGGDGSKVTIDGGNYHAQKELIAVYGGEVVIKDGVFTCDDAAKLFQVYAYGTPKITINGGTFNGKTLADLGKDGLQALTTGGTVVDNGDGTFTISR